MDSIEADCRHCFRTLKRMIDANPHAEGFYWNSPLPPSPNPSVQPVLNLDPRKPLIVRTWHTRGTIELMYAYYENKK